MAAVLAVVLLELVELEPVASERNRRRPDLCRGSLQGPALAIRRHYSQQLPQAADSQLRAIVS